MEWWDIVVTRLILTKANRLIACDDNLSQTESNKNDAEISKNLKNSSARNGSFYSQ